MAVAYEKLGDKEKSFRNRQIMQTLKYDPNK
jgi:hypothetical protein